MKVLVINPVIRKEDKARLIPHGLAIISNMIRRDMNITPEFLDINALRPSDRQVEQTIDDIKPNVVLIGGIIPVYKDIVKWSGYIKETYPETTVIAGGSVASSIPDILLENSKVDIICMGEGEKTIIRVLKDIKRRDVNGIAYKDKKVIINQPEYLIQDLDKESMLPAYDLIPMETYLGNQAVGFGREIDFISSRGCPFKCDFCYQPFGDHPRLHSAKFVINGIRFLKEKYDIDFVAFLDDEFLINKNRVREFCDEMTKFNKDILWSCNGRSNILANDEDLMKKMRDNGCVTIQYGFESGSQKMLDSMHKKQTTQQMEKVTELNRKYGMPIPVSFILGMPGETKETAKETADFCFRNHIPLDSLMFATPYPGTKIYEFALRTGRIKDRVGFVESLKDARDFTVNLTDEFTDDELINLRKSMMENTRKYYEVYMSRDGIIEKTKSLFGKLYEKSNLDEKDWEHRFKHGGISIF
jgi:radical SAM superfamily enzyme YgiQ (UPF0313 family)